MSSIFYKRSIDGLRALAVIGVVLYHFGIGFPGGYVGVDVFFVISGYVITLTIRRSQIENCFSLKDFWLRRIRRVFPALVVIIFFSLVYGYFVLIPSKYVELAGSAVASMTLSANICIWRLANYGYFSDLAGFNPLLHIWSLAIEGQFYLLLPLIFFVSYKIPAANVTRILIFSGVTSFGLSCWAAMNTPSANFFLLPTRAWEFAAGCLLAIHCQQPNSSRWVREIAAFLGILLILLAMAFYSKLTIFPGWTAIPPVLGASLFIYANHSGKTFIGRSLSLPPMYFIGLISYSIYLWHWPALAFSKHLFIDLNLTLRLVLLCGVFVIAVLSWKYIEQPFFKSPLFLSKHKLLSLVMSGCLLVILLGWVIIRQNGFPGRFTLEERQHQADCEPPWRNFHGSFEPYPLGSETAQKNPTFVLWGDSHAVSLISIFEKQCYAKNINGIAFVRGSSIPVPGVFTDGERGLVDCNQRVMDYVRNQPNIQHVILVARWSSYVDGRNSAELAIKPSLFEVGLMEAGDSLENLSVQHSIALLKKHLEIMSIDLNSRGITLWLIEQVPESNNISTAKDFYLHKKYPVLNSHYSPFIVSLADHLDRQKNARTAIAGISDDLINVIDPTPSFFDDNDRLRVFGDRAYYRDDNHLTQSGAMHYLDKLVEEMFQKIAVGTANDAEAPGRSDIK